MTYHPDDPNNRMDPRAPRAREGMSMAAMAGIGLAIVLGLGVLIFAMNRDDRTASTTSPPATTGQTQKAPAPAPTPSPAPKAD